MIVHTVAAFSEKAESPSQRRWLDVHVQRIGQRRLRDARKVAVAMVCMPAKGSTSWYKAWSYSPRERRRSRERHPDCPATRVVKNPHIEPAAAIVGVHLVVAAGEVDPVGDEANWW